MNLRHVEVGGRSLGGGRPFLIAGPCVLESRGLTHEIAGTLAARRGTDRFDELMRRARLIASGERGEIDRGGDAAIKMITWQVVPPAELPRHR